VITVALKVMITQLLFKNFEAIFLYGFLEFDKIFDKIISKSFQFLLTPIKKKLKLKIF
jgi:hypothetical protein